MENDDSQTPSAQNEETAAPESTSEGAAEETSTQEQASNRACRLGEELKEARQCYDDIRHKATERLHEARSTTVGDVLDGVTGFVKQHPRCSLAVAATLGFFMGRLFRR